MSEINSQTKNQNPIWLLGHSLTLNTNSSNTFFTQMEDQLTCAICQDIMYCPCVTSCGHTFCYNCLYEWFKSKERQNTCPNCRTRLKSRPNASLQLKNIVNMFVNMIINNNSSKRKEIEEARNQAMQLYEEDIELRKETFPMLFDEQENLVDLEDGVDRCPYCHWEVHGEYCEHCNSYVIAGDRRARDDDTEREEDEDNDEGEDVTDNEEEDVDDIVGVDNMDEYEDDGFVVDDEDELGGDGSTYNEDTIDNTVDDDDDDDDSTLGENNIGGEDLCNDLGDENRDSTDDPDESVEIGIINHNNLHNQEHNRAVNNRRRTIVISSDEEGEHENDNEMGNNNHNEEDGDGDIEMVTNTGRRDFQITSSDLEISSDNEGGRGGYGNYDGDDGEVFQGFD